MIIGDSLLIVNHEISWFAEKALEAGLINGDWSACLDKLRKLQNLVIFDKRIRFLQARALCALDRYDEAATILTSLVVSGYDSSGLYHCLGSLSFERGRYNESIRNYSKAIERNYGNFIDQSISDNFAGRSKAHFALGQSVEAESDIATIAQLKAFDQARIFYLVGSYKEARQCIESLPIELSTRNFARFLCIRCLVGEQDYAAAIELVSQIVLPSEACKSAFYYRAIAYFHTAQYQLAADDLSQIIADEYGILSVECCTESCGLRICDSLDARLLRAEASYRLGDFVQSMRDLDFVIARRPNVQAYLARSKAAFSLALYRTALGDAEAALTLNALSFEVQHQLNLCQKYLKQQTSFVSPTMSYSPFLLGS